MNPVPSWVSGYRGLWGLYTRDPFEGEDAPAGPMYNRDKTITRVVRPRGLGRPRQGADPAEELERHTGRQAEIEEAGISAPNCAGEEQPAEDARHGRRPRVISPT